MEFGYVTTVGRQVRRAFEAAPNNVVFDRGDREIAKVFRRSSER